MDGSCPTSLQPLQLVTVFLELRARYAVLGLRDGEGIPMLNKTLLRLNLSQADHLFRGFVHIPILTRLQGMRDLFEHCRRRGFRIAKQERYAFRTAHRSGFSAATHEPSD